MKDFVLAVAVFATIAISTAVDEECIERKIRGLSVHWPNPTDCASFYRCTSKNIKRGLLCPEGKEYNPQTGRCAKKGMGLCRLSLAAPLAESLDKTCVDKIPGTFMPDQNSCRSFYLCDNNLSYPQNCNPGSFFDTSLLACAPDNKTVCWENLCLKKQNGKFVANNKDCRGFYICYNEKPIPQTCNEDSYFNVQNLNCQPGKCPSEETTTTITATTSESTSTTNTKTTTSKPKTTITTTTKTTSTITPKTTTKTCTGPTTTCAPETTTTSCVPVTTTTCTTTKCPSKITTTTCTTTTCRPETTTTTCKPDTTTTTCPPEITTTTCRPETTTTTCPSELTTTSCKPETTTTTCTTTTCPPQITTTTTCKPDTTTTTCPPKITTTTCKPETTTTTCTTTTCPPKITTTTCKPDTTTTSCTTTTCRALIPVTTTPCALQKTTTATPICDSSQCQNFEKDLAFPAKNTLDGFCVCLNNKAEYRDCPDGASFNANLKICVSEDKVCPSNKCNNLPNYSTFAAANTTSGFCRCFNEQATYAECADTTFVYDDVLGICSANSQTLNSMESTKLCNGVYKEGDFVSNPDDCMFFYICYEGELEEVNCDRGNYFDDRVKACLPDTDHKCSAYYQPNTYLNNRRHKRSIRASTCPEGAKTPAFDCDKYYKCSKGHRLLYGCGKDNFFNVTTLSCQLDVQHVCWPANSCTEGDKRPYQGDNTKYYECVNGKQVIMSCDSESIFNKLTKYCVARQECTCPGGYKDGIVSVHPTDCDKFYICTDGEQVLHECGAGNYFNEKNKCCEKDLKNICHVKDDCLCPGGYKEGELSAHPTDCYKYYICEDGKQILQECGENNYFDNTTLSCERDLYNECWTKEVCTCPGGYYEGDFSAHPTDCNKYYICHDSKQVLRSCGINNYFNNDTLSCERDAYHVCRPNLCAGQSNGVLIGNPEQCNSLFLCENDEAIPKTCFEGQRFDDSAGACVADLNAVCYNPCANETAGPVVLLSHPICNEFYFCNGYKTFVGTCLVGSFDIETGVCNENKKCFPNPCDNPVVNVFPDPYDVTKFYWCNLQKRPIPYNCPEGTEFNANLEICQKYSDPDCPVCTKDGAYPTLDDTNDSEFCVCNDGLATKIECSQNYTFNPELEVCYSNAPCDPSFCWDAEEYDTAPNRNDSKSFCMCINKEPVIVDCPNDGYFNPYTLECSDYKISPECLQSNCAAKSNNDIIFAPLNTKTSNGFCQCINQIATFRPCSYGSKFNADLLICQLAEINCNSYQCRGLAEKTVIPSVTTTEGYCECNNGVAVYKNCPNDGEFNVTTSKCEAPLCDLSQCATTKTNNDYPFLASIPSGFCLCSDGFIPCETEGTLFSDTFGICIDPCPQTSCDGKPDKYLVSSALNKYSFCVCHSYIKTSPTYELCPSESFVFEESKQLCVPNSEDLCGAEPCKSFGAFATLDTLTGFCFCPAIGQKPKFEFCSIGVFVPELSACVPTADDVCEISLCAQATIDHPITLPANNSITDFCYCSSPKNAMLLPCPQGKYYNQAKAMCISQQEENCKCPNNVPEGKKVADSTNCNKYSICIKGVMQSQTCPTGDYFNAQKNSCMPDTTGTCAKQSACTCLGIYYENELLPHPVNPQMYYACQGNTLHEYNCQQGRVFSGTQKQCIVNTHTRQQRSADINNDHEFACLENDKRSVPSNCSQYEICLQQMWQLKTCPDFYYYNPEQKKCLEPRDDFVCLYAKVTSLPACNASLEFYLLKAKTCQHYYQCENEKWRLKSCERKQYFDIKTSTCLTKPNDAACDKLIQTSNKEVERHCQHLSQRFYDKNCSMYLLCLDNDWWYQYCPSFMYYNRSLNFCVQDTHHQCKNVIRTELKLKTDEFSLESCHQDGLLRASALACNRYFVCLNGKWQTQHCPLGRFYDVGNAKCTTDSAGVCSQLNKVCLTNERRSALTNCTIYEQCSKEGKWLTKTCPDEEIYDDLLQQCTKNRGLCSKHGLKRTCRENEFMSVNNNCSLFLYCYQDTWNVGSCLKGFMYYKENKTCVAHMPQDKCEPFYVKHLTTNEQKIIPQQYLCNNKTNGSLVPHNTDCSRYFVCIQQAVYQEMQCQTGSYFEPSLSYCRPNDGRCRLSLTGVCANFSTETLVAHPSNCRAYYKCSFRNDTELYYCPAGQYFDRHLTQCSIDNGECKTVNVSRGKCADLQHGVLLPHETYCNIYYACIMGLAIPVQCPDNNLFHNILSKCIFDKDHLCQDGHLKDRNFTQNCSNLTDGTLLSDTMDCTRYYVCSEGEAIPKKCDNASYFDSNKKLCMPDDGSCLFVSQVANTNQTAPPDPKECEGKHGNLMEDPLNCNNFYVCINNKLKHERCYTQQYFNLTSQQCQQNPFLDSLANTNTTLKNDSDLINATKNPSKCLDKASSLIELCSEISAGSSFAAPGDCRHFITCQEASEEPLFQRCRNGESFDSLLGFCRQNDGTCLLENGQRVGECSSKHGQLARVKQNCRNYFVCINGQKILQTCEEGKYFSKTQNMCIKDTQHVCQSNQSAGELQSCAGLSENILYPYVQDNCHSYFQCVKGVAKIHKCADDLYFDPIAIKCIKSQTECVMPTQMLKRSPAFSQTFDKLCSNKKLDYSYANIANDCRSFYLCHKNNTVSHELCPLGMLFSQKNNICVNENNTNCTAS